ncbi:hypothetical protein [Flavobacterium tegetincola]|uniref:hypothetical protein n=1 Tax=Flavobacterium tegetincola TaxID=150172 RepID=UPI00041939D9|nr:hypothetical protein [Flavobacterium tegetincola]
MGLSALIIIIILVISFFVFNTKYSIGKKILILVIALIIVFAAVAVVFITGFERGMDPRRETIDTFQNK